MLFNVYYLNFSKVYEIKMMLSNVIKTDKTIETNQGDTVDAELQAKMGTKFLQSFKVGFIATAFIVAQGRLLEF